jgi:16S rRNA (guanine527-N7)-methyltransferase
VKHVEAQLVASTSRRGMNVDELDLDPSARDRLITFAALLARWNPTIKLVSRQDIPHVWSRHIDDALQLVRYMPRGTTHAVDLGSGGGFPGLILAMATDVHFDLIEADSRKAAFLQEAVMATKAAATVHGRRVEDVALGSRKLVTARALAPLPKLLELSHRFLVEDSVCLFPKGERIDAEIADAREDWIMDLRQIPSRTSPDGRILCVTGLQRRVVSAS